MKRCASTKTVPAVRGQTDKAGKPVLVRIACNLPAKHGGPHGNEIGFTGNGPGATPVVLRGAWND